MLNTILAGFYDRDIKKLIEELKVFSNEDNLWKTTGSIKNSSGNLALHIIGGTNYLIGTLLGNTGYIRNRELEFSAKGVPKHELLAQLEQLAITVKHTITHLTPETMEAEYPMVFDGEKRTVTYLLVQLLAHLNYHLGQVSYLRRNFE